jgi:hypothetical protein
MRGARQRDPVENVLDEGTPTEDSASLRALLETGFPRRGARTGRERRLGPADEPVEGAELGCDERVPLRQDRETEIERPVAGDQMSDLLERLEQAVIARMEQRAGRGGRGAQYGRHDYGFGTDGGADRSYERRDRERDFERRFEGAYMSTGRDFGLTATVGDAKFNVAMPPKFDPKKDTWMLWKPQVLSYFEMIGVEGILDPVAGVEYSMRENRFVIGALQSIVPDEDRQWITTLQIKWAYKAWEQLDTAYGSSAEMDMQRKLFDFECARQSENESIREWTIRLERQVKELNVMSSEAAKENSLGFNEHRDTAVYESTHKFRLLNVRIDDAAHNTFIAELRTRVYQMSVHEVEVALITYEQGRQVQQSLSHAAGGPSMYNTNTGRGVRDYGRGGRGGRFNQQELECYACGGVGHRYHDCDSRNTRAGRMRLAQHGITLPADCRGSRRGAGFAGRSGRGGRGGRGNRSDDQHHFTGESNHPRV